jgi:hypothetical protein
MDFCPAWTQAGFRLSRIAALSFRTTPRMVNFC